MPKKKVINVASNEVLSDIHRGDKSSCIAMCRIIDVCKHLLGLVQINRSVKLTQNYPGLELTGQK
jgi:hypothetical protein